MKTHPVVSLGLLLLILGGAGCASSTAAKMSRPTLGLVVLLPNDVAVSGPRLAQVKANMATQIADDGYALIDRAADADVALFVRLQPDPAKPGDYLHRVVGMSRKGNAQANTSAKLPYPPLMQSWEQPDSMSRMSEYVRSADTSRQ